MRFGRAFLSAPLICIVISEYFLLSYSFAVNVVESSTRRSLSNKVAHEERVTCVTHPKQILKRIRKCGDDFSSALDILYSYQPFLLTEDANRSISTHLSKHSVDTKPVSMVIHMLSKAQEYDRAYSLLNAAIQSHKEKQIPTHYLTAVYKSILNMISDQTQDESSVSSIKQIIHDDIPFHTRSCPSLDIYHTALAAFGKCKRMDCIVELLDQMESNASIVCRLGTGDKLDDTKEYRFKIPSPDRMAYLTALTGSIRCKCPKYAMQILDRMRQQNIDPDKVVYNHILSSIANTKFEGRTQLTLTIWQEMEDHDVAASDNKKLCSEGAYHTLIRIFSKENEWDHVLDVRNRLEQNQKQRKDIKSPINLQINQMKRSRVLTPRYIEDLEKLEKRNEIKKTWYKLGELYLPSAFCDIPENTIVFGIQQHKNPVLHGLTLVFYTTTGEKLGFLLIRNSLENSTINGSINDEREANEHFNFGSSILGMKVDEKFRGKGLARIFLAIWLHICLESSAIPTSEVINKPLLSLALTNFGFSPSSSSAVEIEITKLAPEIAKDYQKCKDWMPIFSLYSSNPLNFGERELKVNKMIVTNTRPSPRGKITAVKTCFKHDDLNLLRSKVNQVLQARNQENCFKTIVDTSLLKRVIFGYLY